MHSLGPSGQFIASCLVQSCRRKKADKVLGTETFKFNMALILLPVCRNTITWLHTKTKHGSVVPFDDNLNFHKAIIVGIMVGVELHAISYLTCDFSRLLQATYEDIPMKSFFREERPKDNLQFH